MSQIDNPHTRWLSRTNSFAASSVGGRRNELDIYFRCVVAKRARAQTDY